MKRIAAVLAVIGLALICSCTGPNGPDGEPGEAFAAVDDADGRTYSYWDDNPGIPYGMSWSTYYRTDAGWYDFEYESRKYYSTYYDYIIWSGTYQIWIHPGEKGGEGKPFWQEGDPGADGLDSYLRLRCYYSGPGLSRINKGEAIPEISGETFTVEETSGAFRIRVEYRLTERGKRNVGEPTPSAGKAKICP